MKQRLTTTFWTLFVLLALPATVFAEGDAVNPPGWVGGLAVVVAIALPIGAYVWMKGQR